MLSLNSPDHDQDDQVLDVLLEEGLVTGVSIGNRVRCYSLISLRESSPPRTMFRVYYSSLDR